jgi:hypothetical protein
VVLRLLSLLIISRLFFFVCSRRARRLNFLGLLADPLLELALLQDLASIDSLTLKKFSIPAEELKVSLVASEHSAFSSPLIASK